ncbi:MAG: hypothetical protein WD077_01150 [Bacteroidia bacterium]
MKGTKIKLYLSLIILGALLTSCDRYNYIHYTAENKTADSIKFTFSFGKFFSDLHPTDTTIILKSNQKDTLFIFTQISPSVYDAENETKMVYIFNTEVIRLHDSLLIKKDVSLRKNWNYRETGRNAAVMEFVINDADF